MLSIGILIGAHPWATDPQFDVSNAGLVTNNSSTGAVVNMLLEGFASGSVYGNTMTGNQGTRGLNCSQSFNLAGWHFPSHMVEGPVYGMENDLATSGNPCVPQGIWSPAVELATPAHGAVFSAFQTITVTSNASDPDGTVVRVDYYANGGFVTSTFAAPWTVSGQVGPGTYVIHAVAVDNMGIPSRSKPRTIFVQ